jgi:prolyl-tRNA editing enzyme YbaK/EbsC (Cys-tRNA(Pro) deacylase)
MPTYMERSIAALPYLYVNGGKRGYLVGMTPADLVRVLKPIEVEGRDRQDRLSGVDPCRWRRLR